MGVEEPDAPEFKLPRLESDLDDLTDKQLMNLFVQLTRWADFFLFQFTIDDISERYADGDVRRLEWLYMITYNPERVSEAVTWVRAGMEGDPEITKARDTLRVTYARRKLKQMLFDAGRARRRRGEPRADPSYRRQEPWLPPGRPRSTMTETVLTEAERIVGGNRQQDYGGARGSFDKIAAVWSAILSIDVTGEQVALCMIGLEAGARVPLPQTRQCCRHRRLRPLHIEKMGDEHE